MTTLLEQKSIWDCTSINLHDQGQFAQLRNNSTVQLQKWVTTFEPKWSKQQACNAKAQKGVDWELELELEKQKEMCKEMASVDLQKGADGLSFIMMCYP